MSDLVRFKMVSTRPDTLWRGREVGSAGIPKLVLAGETAEDVKWFFSKIDWTAWSLVPIDAVTDEPKRGPGRPARSTVPA
jgi:hypothetical protein